MPAPGEIARRHAPESLSASAPVGERLSRFSIALEYEISITMKSQNPRKRGQRRHGVGPDDET